MSSFKEEHLDGQSTGIQGEFADIVEIRDEQRERVIVLVDGIIPEPGRIHGFASLINHIDIQEARPVRHSSRRKSPKILEFVQYEVQKMLEKSIIEPSVSEWHSAPAIFHRGKGSYRFCIDFPDI